MKAPIAISSLASPPPITPSIEERQGEHEGQQRADQSSMSIAGPAATTQHQRQPRTRSS